MVADFAPIAADCSLLEILLLKPWPAWCKQGFLVKLVVVPCSRIQSVPFPMNHLFFKKGKKKKTHFVWWSQRLLGYFRSLVEYFTPTNGNSPFTQEENLSVSVSVYLFFSANPRENLWSVFCEWTHLVKTRWDWRSGSLWYNKTSRRRSSQLVLQHLRRFSSLLVVVVVAAAAGNLSRPDEPTHLHSNSTIHFFGLQNLTPGTTITATHKTLVPKPNSSSLTSTVFPSALDCSSCVCQATTGGIVMRSWRKLCSACLQQICTESAISKLCWKGASFWMIPKLRLLKAEKRRRRIGVLGSLSNLGAS